VRLGENDNFNNNAEITKVAKFEIFEAGLPLRDPLLLDPRGIRGECTRSVNRRRFPRR
jgi:hypothetical protein